MWEPIRRETERERVHSTYLFVCSKRFPTLLTFIRLRRFVIIDNCLVTVWGVNNSNDTLLALIVPLTVWSVRSSSVQNVGRRLNCCCVSIMSYAWNGIPFRVRCDRNMGKLWLSSRLRVLAGNFTQRKFPKLISEIIFLWVARNFLSRCGVINGRPLSVGHVFCTLFT